MREMNLGWIGLDLVRCKVSFMYLCIKIVRGRVEGRGKEGSMIKVM